MSNERVDVVETMQRARRTISAQSKLSDDVMAHLAYDVEIAHDAMVNLISMARNASAVLSHIYHTVPMGELENDAHDAYQAIDKAIASVMGCNCPGEGRYAPSSHAPNCRARAALSRIGGSDDRTP